MTSARDFAKAAKAKVFTDWHEVYRTRQGCTVRSRREGNVETVELEVIPFAGMKPALELAPGDVGIDPYRSGSYKALQDARS